VNLSGAASKTTTADASGNYSFTGLVNGAYSVGASKSGGSVTPTSKGVTVNGSNVAGVNFAFTASATPTWSISGNVSSGSGATVNLSGAVTKTATADASGNYTFAGLVNGAYAISASKSGGSITPASKSVTVNGANVASVNFAFTASTTPTWSISGSVSSGSGATVNLSGAASKTATTDASGNYSFAGLVDGAYTVIASKAGGTMTPASKAVSLKGANVTGVNFTYTATQGSWIISGTVASGSGATVTLGGAASRTVTADASGKYSFTGLVNGSYTVAPWKSGMTFTPSARTVAVSGANQASIDFAVAQQDSATPQIDSTVWQDSAVLTSTLISPAFATQKTNELLLAFIGTDSMAGTETVRGVSGAGLTWTFVRRSNDQAGTAEIWRAFAPKALSGVSVTASLSTPLRGALTVVTFSGVDTTGKGSAAIGDHDAWSSNTGEPEAFIVTSRNQSLVIGVGNDASQAAARTPASGQSIVHEFVDKPEGTYWVQRFTNPVATAGTRLVFGSSPASAPINMTSVEVRGPAPVALDMMSSMSGGVGAAATASSNEAAATSRGRRAQRDTSEVTLANAVTGEPGDACSPGGWASVIGSAFTAQAPQTASTIPLPMTLAGVRVSINGQPAPLLLASSEQVNFQCPNAPVGTALEVKLTTEDETTWTVAASSMSAAAPAIFTVEGTDRAVVQIASSNQLAAVSDPAATGRPARAGEHVRIYASGLGEAVTQLAPGMPAPIDKPIPVTNKVIVLWNGMEVEPLFAGLAPGTVGVFQVDLEVPAGATTGTVPLSLRVELPDGSEMLAQPTVVPVESPVTLAARVQ
jgi:uncharacterized protein (TIGR03437 family)